MICNSLSLFGSFLLPRSLSIAGLLACPEKRLSVKQEEAAPFETSGAVLRSAAAPRKKTHERRKMKTTLITSLALAGWTAAAAEPQRTERSPCATSFPPARTSGSARRSWTTCRACRATPIRRRRPCARSTATRSASVRASGSRPRRGRSASTRASRTSSANIRRSTRRARSAPTTSRTRSSSTTSTWRGGGCPLRDWRPSTSASAGRT